MSNKDDSEERERHFQELAAEAEEYEREAYRQFYYQACENFDYYWHTELSKERPIGNEDHEEFARRIAEMAYMKALDENYKI